MTTGRMLLLAGFAALAACGNDRQEQREVAVSDSLTRELEVAPEDSAAPLSDERQSQAGGRASAPAVAPAAKQSRTKSEKAEAARKRAPASTRRSSAAKTARRAPADSEVPGASATAEPVPDTATSHSGTSRSTPRDTVASGDPLRGDSLQDAVRADSGIAAGVPESPVPSDSTPQAAAAPTTATPSTASQPAQASVPAPSPRSDTAVAPARTAMPATADSQSAPPAGTAASGTGASGTGATSAAATAEMHELPAGMHVRALLQDSIHSLRNSAGQRVTALVSGDLRAPDGRTLVPSGSVVRLVIERLKPARTRSAADGELELRPDSVVVNGRAYPVRAEVQPVPHELKGRGVTAGEAEKVAAGAAVGAVAGGVITGKTKGAVVGGAVGAAGGAVVAAQTASRDVVVTPRTLIVMTLTAPFAPTSPASAGQ
jgi:hypothetical protein